MMRPVGSPLRARAHNRARARRCSFEREITITSTIKSTNRLYKAHAEFLSSREVLA